MCGIVGIYSLDNSKILNLKSRLKKMIKMIDYRGPDNLGFYINQNDTFGMANNQLSIVSPNKKIKLPITYDNKNFMSFNGEIYNYLDLKKKYKIPRKNFKYNTDTEVLYYLLNQKNADLSDLNGVWSFAHYDNEKHILKLGRDILGERNLYYYINHNELIFSSEIRPIFAANNLTYSIDNIGLQDMFKYYTCRENRTVIKGCFKLTPGTYSVFKESKTNFHSKISLPLLSPEKYFDFLKGKSEKIIQKKFQELMSQELDLRFTLKVKAFSQLSGGIDSTYQNNLLSRIKKVNTIYAISSNFNYLNRGGISEMDLAQMVSKKIGSKHQFVDLRENFYKEALRSSKNTLETLDPAILNFSNFSRILRSKRSKVVIGADGPDEFLCGYSRDIENFSKNKKKFRNVPYHEMSNFKKNYGNIFEKLEKDTNFFSEPDKRYKKIEKYLDTAQMKALTYSTKSLPEYINIRADKGFMLNSIEIRQPFLSKNIVEFLCALPTKFRFSKKKDKGKMFLRNELSKQYKLLSNYPKVGFAKNLIMDGKVYKELERDIKDTINDKKIMEKINFKKEAKDFFLNTPNKSRQYMMFSLIRSLKNLKC